MLGFKELLTALRPGGDRQARRHLEAGQRFVVQARDEDAVREFREAIRLAPDLAEAHRLLGVALMGAGVGKAAGRDVDEERCAEAVAALREALRLRPGDARAHGHLGEALHSLGRHSEAVASLQDCQRLDPSLFDSVQSFRRRLECSLEGRRWDGVR